MSDYKEKHLLLVNSGGRKKEFILQRLKDLGVDVVLVNKTASWEKKYIADFIKVDTYNHSQVLAKVREFIKGKKIDGVLTFWEDDLSLVAKIADRIGLVGLSPRTAEYARNKYEMRKVLARFGLESPKFMSVTTFEDLSRAIKEVGLPAVIKPAFGADSEFVVKVTTIDEAKNFFEYVKKNATPSFNPIYVYNNSTFIYEEYIEGDEVNVDSITQNGETQVISISDKDPMREPFFVEQGDTAPSMLDPMLQVRVEEHVKLAIKAINLTDGISHTEVKICKGDPVIVEINGRMGGDYIWDWVKTVWEVDLIEQSVRIAFGLPVNFEKASRPQKYLIGKYLIPTDTGVISKIRFLNDVKEFKGYHDLYLNKGIGDSILVPPEGFETIGWVVAEGESFNDAEANLYRVLNNIEYNVLRFSPTSSIGQTRRRNISSAAYLARVNILRRQAIEKIRLIQQEEISKLRVGVLCNLYDPAEQENGDEPNDTSPLVKADLTSVGMNIKKALVKKEHEVLFFDMNEYPLPFKKIMDAKVDIIFNVCERINNSSLLEPHAAAFLDMLNIPYTGSNMQTLAICIDKIRMKKLLHFHDIPTAKWDYVYDMDDEISDELKFPLIVKPANSDNSIGITNESVVTNHEELQRQLKRIVVDQKRPALIEEYIEGDEYDVTIVGNEDNVTVLPLSRSIFDDLPKGVWHIYPFEAKWKKTAGTPYDLIKVERPAKIPAKLASLITEIALDTYNILDAHDYARIEIRVDKDGNPYVIELNPNPSINEGDACPAMADLVGYKYEDFIEWILKSCIQRYKDKPPYYHLTTSTAI
ncbi:MAG: ATP-grasp domain-containing protein [Nanoarchaeota archaeon]